MAISKFYNKLFYLLVELLQCLKDQIKAYDLNTSLQSKVVLNSPTSASTPNSYPNPGDMTFSDSSFNANDSYNYPSAPTASAIATPNVISPVGPPGMYPTLPISPGGSNYIPNAPPASHSSSFENFIVEKFQQQSINPKGNGDSNKENYDGSAGNITNTSNGTTSPLSKTPPYNPYYCLRSNGRSKFC